jgi:TonB-dependent SusC/RagA subfamily outer membrane receptor
VVVTSSGGTQGTDSRSRIRGLNSLSLGNDPLIILGGHTISRFDDINPDDLENIEIVKSPAATALYGTAAANGVIQFTSKRGCAGKPKWNTSLENGSESQIADFSASYATIGSVVAGGNESANEPSLR